MRIPPFSMSPKTPETPHPLNRMKGGTYSRKSPEGCNEDSTHHACSCSRHPGRFTIRGRILGHHVRRVGRGNVPRGKTSSGPPRSSRSDDLATSPPRPNLSERHARRIDHTTPARFPPFVGKTVSALRFMTQPAMRSDTLHQITHVDLRRAIEYKTNHGHNPCT